MDVAYQDDVYVDDRTIDSHIKRLRRKFREVDQNSTRSRPSMASDTDSTSSELPDPQRRGRVAGRSLLVESVTDAIEGLDRVEF